MAHIVSIPETREYALAAPFGAVPAGFRTDGASLPRLLWPVLGSPFSPELIDAAIVHDYAYRYGVPDRRMADLHFRAMLRGAGVGRFRAWCFWAGVRIGGWVFWRKCRYGRGMTG